MMDEAAPAIDHRLYKVRIAPRPVEGSRIGRSGTQFGSRLMQNFLANAMGQTYVEATPVR